MIYKYLDIYNQIFDDYYNFIKDNVTYDIKVSKTAPKNFNEQTKFPIIVLREASNTNTRYMDTQHLEFIDRLIYQADIYTKDFVDSEGQHYSIDVQRELQMLTNEFFLNYRMRRETQTNWENNNLVYDRLTLVFQGHLSSWNRHIV